MIEQLPTGETEARILIVDDNPQNVALIRARLERAGYDVATAASGADGLQIAATEPPDLILLDIMMPGMDGYEVCRRLKADAATRGIPVVFLTSMLERSNKVRALDVEVDDFLSKSVDQAELVTRVRSLLRQKRLFHEELARVRAEAGGQVDRAEIERNRSRAILRHVRCGVLTTNLAGYLSLLNPAAEELAGVRLESALGRPWREALDVRERDGRPLSDETCPIREVLRLDRPVAARELLIRRPNGREEPISLVAEPVRRVDGQTVEVLAVLRKAAPPGGA